MKRFISFLALGIALIGASSIPAVAQLTYTFSLEGTFDFSFSESEEFGGNHAYPFVFEFTIDPSLNTYSGGAVHSGDSFYGYSRNSLVSTSFTLGSTEWTANDLSPRSLPGGYTADFWLNADVVTDTPTEMWMRFVTAQPELDELTLGGAFASSGSSGLTYHFSSTAHVIFDGDFMTEATSNGAISLVAVPEPSTYGMLLGGCAMIGVICFRRYRRS